MISNTNKDWVDYAVEELGHSMGIDGLYLSENNSISLDIENVGKVFLERSNQDICLSLIKDCSKIYFDKGVFSSLLDKCHYSNMNAKGGDNINLHVGMMPSQDGIVFMTKVGRENATGRNLESNIKFLKNAANDK